MAKKRSKTTPKNLNPALLFIFSVFIFLNLSCDDIKAIPNDNSEASQYEELKSKYDTTKEVADEVVPSGLSSTADSSYWIKTYGGYYFSGTAIRQTLSGDYILSATVVTDEKGGDLFAMKLDDNGDIEWNGGYGRESFDPANSILEIAGDGYLLTGRLYAGESSQDYWALKLNLNGSIQWQKTFGGNNIDYINTSIKTSDGGCILAGRTYFDTGDTICDILLIKIDLTGNILWERKYETGEEVNDISSITECPDGSLVALVSGNKIVKLDSLGNVLWCKHFDSSISLLLNTVEQTSDNGFIISAYINPFLYREFLIIKVDSMGNVVWSKVFGDPAPKSGTIINTAETVHQTTDGGYIILANTEIDKYYCYFPTLVANEDPAGYKLSTDLVRVIKLDSSGTVTWEESYRNTLKHKWFLPSLLRYNTIKGDSIQETSSGDFILSGIVAYSDYSDSRMFVMKITGDGVLPESDFLTIDSKIQTRSAAVSTNDSSITSDHSSIFFMKNTTVTSDVYTIEVDDI